MAHPSKKTEEKTTTKKKTTEQPAKSGDPVDDKKETGDGEVGDFEND